jgi:nitroreductase
MKKEKMPSHHGYKEKSVGTYPNETMKLLMERASCRNFANKRIPKNVLNMILETGTHAATGGNLQPYSIIKIESKRTRDKLAKMCYQSFIAKAPVSLIFCIDWRRLQRWAEIEAAPFTATSSFRHFWISFQDTIICAQNICTAADSFGLGSVYIGTIMDLMRDVHEMLRLPGGVLPVVLLCLGYPRSALMVRRKLGREVVVHDEKYRELSNRMLKHAYDEKYHSAKIEITDERLERMRDVCQKVEGSDFVEKCMDRIAKNGFINVAQRYFGLHYAADIMPGDNEDFIKIMKEFGFNWFEAFKPKMNQRRNRNRNKEKK